IINNGMLGQVKWEQPVFLGNQQPVGFVMKLKAIMKLIFSAVFALVLAASTVFCQNAQTSPTQQAARPLNMLVLGDSIIWGQGLKAEHKSWYQIKLWLEKNTGRTVIEKVEANSGAVIERSSPRDNLT